MASIRSNLVLTVVLSVGTGILAIVPVVTSENGYVAGFVYFPLLCLLGFSCFVLFVLGIAYLSFGKNFGLYFLLAMVLLPIGFFGAALTARHFELGAYREDPMVPLIPEVSNIVLFKKGTTDAQIEEFWNETLSTKRNDGRGYKHLPGLRTTMRLLPHRGYEAGVFEFFDTATDEERGFVYSQVTSSPIVFELLQNVPTKDYMLKDDPPSNDNRPKKEMKIENR